MANFSIRKKYPMKDKPHKYSDDRKRGHVKRKYDGEAGTESKRLKQEFNEGWNSAILAQRRLALPSLARRPVEEVLVDVVAKVSQGDRQLAGHLLREFSLEHLSSIEKSAVPITNLLLDALLISKHDQISNAVLKHLKHVLSCTDKLFNASILLKLFTEGQRLINSPGLDVRILSLITDSYERGILQSVSVPSSVILCADRSLHNISNSQSRISSIQFHIARVFSAVPRRQKDYQELESIITEMTSDRDCRVRLSAAEGLLKLSNEGELSMQSYGVVKALLNDTNSQVRKILLKILLNYAQSNPMFQVKSSAGQNMLLCDDSFSSICHAINDMEVDVRAEAAVLLGEFEYVSDNFLEQTLDKKLMRTMKTTGAVKHEKTSMFSITKQPWVKGGGNRWKSWKDNRDKQKKFSKYGNSEWASGKDLNAPCPSNPSTSKEEEDSIIPQGACGAFVSALEDEFMTVRKGAVYSLGKLAAHRPFFASTALEHLTDMFNDEIADVRLDAILALTPLVVHGQLLKEQLAVMLKCLDDAMYESRQALRDLLGKGEFADASCMQMTTRALINCLNRFPSDKDMIYRCFSQLGAKHGVFVHTMVEGLLNLHPIYEPQEKVVDDVFYLGILILILSAASSYEPIISLLPGYVLKHYRFMRASSPHLVPPIKTLDERFTLNSNVPTLTDSEEVNAEILGQTYTKLRDTVGLSTVPQRNLARSFISTDAEAICSFNTILAGAAQFLNILSELMSATDSLEENIIRGGDLSRVLELLSEEITNSLSALKLFSNVDDVMQSYMQALRFHLQLLAGMAKLILRPDLYATIILELREIIKESKEAIEELEAPLETHENAMLEVLNILDGVGMDEKKFLSTGRIGDILSRTTPQLPAEFKNIERIAVKWAQITEPDRQTAIEKPLKFIAGYPTVTPLSVTLHHFFPDDLLDLRIQIDYPDQTKYFFKPRSADFCKTEEGIYNLSTKVLIQSSVPWSDAALIKFTVVLMAGAHRSVPVAVLESPATRKPSSIVIRVRPVHKM